MAYKNGMYIVTINGICRAANILEYYAGDGQWTDVSFRAKRLEKALSEGYIFVPAIAATPERIAMLEMLIDLAQYDLDEGYRRDSALVETVAGMRAMLTEMRGGNDGK